MEGRREWYRETTARPPLREAVCCGQRMRAVSGRVRDGVSREQGPQRYDRAGHPPRGFQRYVYTELVYTEGVKNITLSVEERFLERAREVARSRSTTLNQLFREWLAEMTSEKARKHRYDDLMRRLGHVRSGGRFSRDEMNAR